ncbi:MAG: hypothetical protein HC925_02540 [Coleofasciculaceae cyanobacterium SM2_3_26]|nr:hypothetical protein [Coleofasciculaceae cyanobacterium SM2_3_26]
MVRSPQPGESAADYHLVFAGFLPVEEGAIAGDPLTFTTKDLLYAGGLRAYLLSIAASSTLPVRGLAASPHRWLELYLSHCCQQ